MKKRNLIFAILLLLNVFVLFWSANYLISYAGQNQLGSVGFGIIFSAALLGITMIGLKWLNDT
jgi:hypothetical protein